MLRREGRLDNQAPESRRKASDRTSNPVAIRNWERPIFVLALIVILVLGGIAGMNSLLALAR